MIRALRFIVFRRIVFRRIAARVLAARVLAYRLLAARFLAARFLAYRFLAACLALLSLSMAAQAQESRDPRGRDALEEQLISGATVDEVAITATFSGEEVFVFGAIQRNRRLDVDEGRPEIIVVIQGPSSPLIVRRKARVFGLWINRDAFRIAAAPSYYSISSTGPLAEILQPGEDLARRISLRNAVLIAGAPVSAEDPEAFRRAVIRLRTARGLYREDPMGVTLTGGTLYQARVRLPASIVEGLYVVRVYLVRDGRVRDVQEIALPVFKQGLERTLGAAAEQTPLLYGIGTLITALLAAWGASELFRRLRR